VQRVLADVKAIALAVALATVATLGGGCVLLRAPNQSERPRWRVTAPTAYDHGCVLGRAFIRKSGKDGVGMTVELRSRTTCQVVIARAELVLASGERVPAGIRQVAPMTGRSLLYTWLAFPFDNNRAWNRGVVDGAFELDLVLDGAPAPTWRFAAHHGR